MENDDKLMGYEPPRIDFCGSVSTVFQGTGSPNSFDLLQNNSCAPNGNQTSDPFCGDEP